YRWLENGESAEVKQWWKAQDDLAQAKLRAIPARAELETRIKELMFAGDVRSPGRFGARYFYERRDAGSEKHVVYVRERSGGSERALIDPSQWPAEQSWTLQGYWPSPDGRKVAYKISKNNADLSTVHVLDVETGEVSSIDTIAPVRSGEADWAADSRGFYYRHYSSDPSIPSNEQEARASIRYHRIGTEPKNDIVVREPTGDSRIDESVVASRDARWLFVRREYGESRTDWYFRDAKRKAATWIPLAVGLEHQHEVIEHNGVFYVSTNDGAERGRIVRVDPAHPERQAWKEIIPGRTDATLEEFLVAGGKLFLHWKKDVAAELEIRELDGSGTRTIELPTLGGIGASWRKPLLSGHAEDDEVFIRFESYATPAMVYSISTKTGQIRIWAKVDLPGVEPSRYAVDRVFFASKDGTRVPMFVVHRRDVPLDGRGPVIMTAYGGFALAIAPSFYPANYTWVERGGVFVQVAARGGLEYGEAWHREGMLTKKQNTFDDVIAAAEDLIRRGWARPERLGLRGGSNGGLTTAAVITQRPDLFRAAVCDVPVIDVIRSPLFGNGKSWETEYGSPEDPEQFKAMFAYSPYHHAEGGKRYPSLLVQGADSDDRVDPMHARKFAAAMQAVASDRPVLLRVRQSTGHFGAGAVSADAEYQAGINAFLLSEMGVP
ncbi:MAG TPA: prolyl oligopeptidase family serine peptidase, partial [Polyangiaceae bacterium]|nr:prolyl oligopeptidase family serine peptidase [Polyangiaceae bacterium]